MIGFLLVPPVAGFLAFLGFPVLIHSGYGVLPPGNLADPAGAARGFGLGVGILAVGVTAFGVVPTVLWLRKRGPLSLRRVVVAGAALGNAPFALIVLIIVVVQLVNGTITPDVARLWYGLAGAVRSVLIGTFVGTASAAVFWAIAVRGTQAAES